MLTPQPDGKLASAEPVLLPVMAPRLQADCRPDGFADISLWGVGRLGRVRFTALNAPYLYGPNRLLAADGGIHAAQSGPVLLIRGARLRQVHPARRCAWWHDVKPEAARPTWSTADAARVMELPWGVLAIEQRDADLVIAAGASRQEALAALALSAEDIVAEAAAYEARCDRLPEAEPLVRSMVIQGVHAAL